MSTEQQPLSTLETVTRLQGILERATPIGFDTEGAEWPTCIGFAPTTRSCLVIDTLGLKGHPDAAAIWQLCQAIVESDKVTKICWNAAHEREFLQWTLGWRMASYEDAMFTFHERWPELRKSLKYAASILTRIPCWTTGISWKENDDRPAAHGPVLWRYNGYDCCATLEIWQHPQLQPACDDGETPPPFVKSTPESVESYRQLCASRSKRGLPPPIGLPPIAIDRYLLNLSLIEPANYASQKGVLYDHQAAEKIREGITGKLWEAQARVDCAAGLPLPKIIKHCAENLCFKKKRADVVDLRSAIRYAKKAHRESIERVQRILGRGKLCPAARGEIGALLGTGLNVKSTKQVTATLNRLGLPPIYKPGKRKANPDDNESTDSTAPAQTKDAAALLTLFLRTNHPITIALLETIALRDRLKELKRGVDTDGRIRSSLQLAGPSTDRTASHKWLTGGGGNVQTIPKEPVNFRVCYCADPGHLWFKLDLTGADLWTVAARVAAEGDRTLLDDLRGGVRVPSLVGLMLEHGYRPGSDRAQIKADCVAYRAGLKAKGEGWKDTVWKKSSHLTNYGGSAKRIRQSVIEDTYAETGTPIDPGLALCQRVQTLYLSRYWGIPKWWSRVASTVARTGKLVYATGREREFLARRVANGCLDEATKRQALAAEPQAITGYVILTGLHRLWHDLANWPSGEVGIGDPIVQPLIPCVHDECTGQFPADQRAWAIAKLKEWFTVTFSIGREAITMPFDGSTGPNWGECKDKF